MIDDALAAANQIFSPPFRAVLWKTLGLTLALLGLLWIALDKLLVAAVALPHAWVGSWAASWANSWTLSWAAAALSLIGGLGTRRRPRVSGNAGVVRRRRLFL